MREALGGYVRARVRIYNLAPDTIAKLQRRFTRMRLDAGHEQRNGMIFEGDINLMDARATRCDEATALLNLTAKQGDQALNEFVANRQLFATAFPPNPFGNAVRTAARVIASDAGVAVVRLSLGGFDTHSNQLATHARLLSELAQGLVALKSALVELGRWDRTLVATYAEFGRRPRENQSGGTDHGTASVHFALGGRVAGGLLGSTPELGRVGDGNLAHAIDFRSVYATILERWWSIDSRDALGARHALLPMLRA